MNRKAGHDGPAFFVLYLKLQTSSPEAVIPQRAGPQRGEGGICRWEELLQNPCPCR